MSTRGKNTTVKTILSNVRVKTGTVNDGALTDLMLIDLLNARVGEIALKLRALNHPFYMETETLTLSGSSYPLTSVDPPIDRIIKLVDASLGIVPFVSPEEYERIGSFSDMYANSLFAVVEGEAIRITKGSGLGSHGTLSLHYARQLTKATSTSDYPDVPDSQTSLLIDLISIDVWNFKGKETMNLVAKAAKDLAELKAA